MFENFKEKAKLLKEAKNMSSKMKGIQQELKKVTVTGYSPRKKVKVTLNGEMDCMDIWFDEDVTIKSEEDRKKLQKACKAAFNDAIKKAKGLASSRLSELSRGLGLG